MITQVTKETEAEYFRRLGQAPFFASVMHTVYASCGGKGVQCYLAGRLAALQAYPFSTAAYTHPAKERLQAWRDAQETLP